MITEEYIQDKITQTMECSFIEVVDQSAAHKGHSGYREGGGSHFHVLVVSEAFEGLSKVKRHQKIYAALQEEMKQQIHALALKTMTPSEYQA